MTIQTIENPEQMQTSYVDAIVQDLPLPFFTNLAQYILMPSLQSPTTSFDTFVKQHTFSLYSDVHEFAQYVKQSIHDMDPQVGQEVADLSPHELWPFTQELGLDIAIMLEDYRNNALDTRIEGIYNRLVHDFTLKLFTPPAATDLIPIQLLKTKFIEHQTAPQPETSAALLQAYSTVKALEILNMLQENNAHPVCYEPHFWTPETL